MRLVLYSVKLASISVTKQSGCYMLYAVLGVIVDIFHSVGIVLYSVVCFCFISHVARVHVCALSTTRPVSGEYYEL